MEIAMRVLMTGCDGYIGAVMAPLLEKSGIQVVGLDTCYFAGCTFGDREPRRPALRRDLRDVRPEDLSDFDAVIHLAALSNDPLSDLDPECTFDINHRASVRLAELARAAGVERFLYSSSCSVYGAGSADDVLAEDASFDPITPYAKSKVQVEADVSKLASDDFSPTFLRNATVYGVSPRLRGDLVVNNLVGWALTTGRVLLKSDGTPWRPLVHVEDVSRAFLAVLRAGREVVHNQAFNVGRSGENYRIRDVADLVQAALPDSRIDFAEGAGPDPRCYRVDFAKIEAGLPGFRPRWDVAAGVAELRDAFRAADLRQEELEGDRYLRIRRIRNLLEAGRLSPDLRWIGTPGTGEAA
jgi:nucleoside-diphosphate-sugar epimerase